MPACRCIHTIANYKAAFNAQQHEVMHSAAGAVVASRAPLDTQGGLNISEIRLQLQRQQEGNLQKINKTTQLQERTRTLALRTDAAKQNDLGYTNQKSV